MTIRHLLPVVLPGLVLSCAGATYQAPAPTVSKAGVAVSVVSKERCFISRDGEKFPTPANDERFNLDMKVRFDNDSNRVVVVTPERLRLAGDADGKRTEMSPTQGGDVSLQPRESQTVALQFRRTGALDCHHPLELETAQAVTMDGKPIGLDPIRLVSAR